MGQTAKYQLIQLRLGRDLAQYVSDRQGSGDSWRTISADLSTLTGVHVSHETLRSWFVVSTKERAA